MAIWLAHDHIQYIPHVIGIQSLSVQLKGSMGDTSKDVHGSTDNYNCCGELEIICVSTSVGVDWQGVV